MAASTAGFGKISGASGDGTLIVNGLYDVRKALSAVAADAVKGESKALREIGDIVASEAKSVARQKGLTGTTGDLVNKIRPSVTQSAVYVRDNAMRTSGKNAPFSYPFIWEFGGGGVRSNKNGGWSKVEKRSLIGAQIIKKYGERAGVRGGRAFLGPALTRKEVVVEQKFNEWVDRLFTTYQL